MSTASIARRSVAWGAVGVGVMALVGIAAILLLLPSVANRAWALFGQTGGQPAGPAVARPAAPSEIVRVKTIAPSRERLERLCTQPAQVEPWETTDLFAKASGYVRTIHVDIGDRVAKNQTLAELWIPEMEQEQRQKQALLEQAQASLGQSEAALVAAQAMVAAAQARVEEAQAAVASHEAEATFRRSEHQRYERLAGERAVPRDQADEKLNQLQAAEADLTAAKAAVGTAEANLAVERAKVTQAEADVTSAKAQITVAQADLEQTDILLAYGTVKAPYAGIVTGRRIDTGAFVQSAAVSRPVDPLFTMIRVDRLRIVADIPENDSAWIKVGQRTTLRVDAAQGREFAGQVTRFTDALDPATRTMRTEIELDEPTDLLRPGMYGSVAIVLADTPDAILLPASAVMTAGGKPYVMLAAEGRARRREVELGINDGVRVQITGGLTGDEAVITDGKGAVREGQAVEVVR